jgi:predicted Fe-Mo cluster-binding NifX family protein
MRNKLTFTIAVDHSDTIKPRHFGDADKFLIYEYNCEEIAFSYELANAYKTYDENHGHGSSKKGEAIVGYLKDHGVNILVSKQFGKNIKIVSQHFVPVLVSGDKPNQVIPTLQAHVDAIKAEWEKNTETYQHLNLKNKVL